MKQALNICLFSGPGVGKSMTAAGLFHRMKAEHERVELVQEYAKDLVYSKDFFKIKDQVMILARQHHPWFKMKHQVDYLVHDGPFLIGLAYLDEESIPTEPFTQLVVGMYKNYPTLNIFLERSEDYPYQTYGRNQTEEEAKEIDNVMRGILEKHNIPYHNVKAGQTAVENILKLVEEKTLLLRQTGV